MKPSRNDPCPCGSGKKYKHCCYAKDSVKHEEPVIAAEPAEPAEESDAETEDAGDRSREKHQHQKDRSRFKGEVQGKTSTFRSPRATRGAQRGS
jgi:hypothetical protein